ncbi:MAG: AI-2E family transporter [Dehalococcoidales bacterium]|nr:AI-2E family transporter [Dehalococcoidales bacterium]
MKLQKHSNLIYLTVSLALIFILLYSLRNIILPFIIGLVLAYILLPVSSWIEQRFPKPHKWKLLKRISAIIIVYLLILAFLGTAGFYIVTTSVRSFASIVNNAPDYFLRAFEAAGDTLAAIRDWLPPGAEQQIDDFMRNFGQNLGEALRNVFTSGIKFIPTTFSYVMGFATLPIFLFYILKDHEYLNQQFYSWLPETAAGHFRNMVAIINQVLGGYIRSQLTMGLFVGVLALIGLLVINAPLPFGLAIVAGVTELVPILGPWIGGGIAVIVVLATEPAKTIWVIVIFFAIQIIENTLLVPRIQGHYLHVHPTVAIVLIIIGASIAGFWGLILAVPLASTLVRLYRYVTKTAREEDVGSSSATQ